MMAIILLGGVSIGRRVLVVFRTESLHHTASNEKGDRMLTRPEK